MKTISEKIKTIYHESRKADVIIAEGTTASGKTTGISNILFMTDVLQSPKKLHLIMSKTTGTAEKNIISSDEGLLTNWGSRFKYMGNGSRDYKFPHLISNDGSKVIMIIGYDNAVSNRNILGSQFGIAYVDEGNTAHIETLRELMTRADKIYMSNNPDNPDLPYFTEIVNHAVDKTPDLTPHSIKKDMLGDKEKWHYYFFGFGDNPVLTPEAIEKKKSMLDPSTKIYKNKILGERCKAVGLVFNMKDCYYLDYDGRPLQYISIGVDTSYSSKSADELTCEVIGVDYENNLWVIDEYGHNNRDGEVLAPSDFIPRIRSLADLYNVRDIFVDCADQGTITEARKIDPQHNYIDSYKQTKIIDRINLMSTWLWSGKMFISNKCEGLKRELNVYSWQESKDAPEDGNDHYINALQYAFLPYKNIIGKQ